MPAMPQASCLLCQSQGGQLIFATPLYRVVWPNEPQYPGLLRVISQNHHAEMTELPAEARDALMHAVYVIEATLRKLAKPHKINLASLGNQVPHLHWHIIPRWVDDPHFPNSIWSAPAPSTRENFLQLSIDWPMIHDVIAEQLAKLRIE